jgi:hypothetical protein
MLEELSSDVIFTGSQIFLTYFDFQCYINWKFLLLWNTVILEAWRAIHWRGHFKIPPY